MGRLGCIPTPRVQTSFLLKFGGERNKNLGEKQWGLGDGGVSVELNLGL